MTRLHVHHYNVVNLTALKSRGKYIGLTWVSQELHSPYLGNWKGIEVSYWYRPPSGPKGVSINCGRGGGLKIRAKMTSRI